jgi:hypothetical protein
VIAGEVVASRIGFALGRTPYLYYSGYQPAWADDTPSTPTRGSARCRPVPSWEPSPGG